MQDKRKHPRKPVNVCILIRDLSEGTVLGHLVNISPEGLMMLFSAETVAIDTLFKLSLELPEDLGCGPGIEFAAESLWSEPSNELNRQWVGFRIIHIRVNHQERLQHLIEAL